MKREHVVGALAVLVSAGLGVWWFLPDAPAEGEAQRERGPRSHPNVLIVLWDTTRADHLTVYGHDKPTTPNLAKWAETGVVFEKAISPAMWTVPSHASMFTGVTSTTHGADYDYRWLDAANVTLAETLAASGYYTYAFSANPNLADSRVNLLQGVSTIEMAWRGRYKRVVGQLTRKKLIGNDASTEISPGYPGRKSGHFYYNAAPVTGEALGNWLDERDDQDRPWFAYLNYMEAHKPRVPSLAARERVVDSPEELELGLTTDLSLDQQLLYSVGALEYTPEQLAAIDAVYDATLTELDDWTGRLFADLERRGELNDTVIVFTSDHGENLGDHHLFGHRHGLYQALVHVPLVISYPAKLEPKRVQAPTSNLDLYYTITRLAGVEPPPAPQPMFRTDLLASTGEAVFSETIGIDREGIHRVLANDLDAEKWMHTFQSVIAAGWKLIETSKGERELYNLINDPDELADLATAEPAKVAELDALLDGWHATVPPYDPSRRLPGEGPVVDDAETKAALAALGYLDGAEDEPEEGPEEAAPSAAPCAGLAGEAQDRCGRIEAACDALPTANAAKCRAHGAGCGEDPEKAEACLRDMETRADRFLQKRGR
ncbi:MAG: sulfatase [Deltaproteobacteria bacterium]|nr:sulfatase [Deltaproteobacteria bacterium]